MAIPMKQIPAMLLVPGAYQEIDNSLAGTVTEIRKVLLIGYKAQSGSAEVNKPIQVLSTAKAAEYCGWGSPLAVMAEAFLSVNRAEECWLLPMAEPGAGTKLQQDFTIEAENAGSGSITITVCGRVATAAVTAQDSAAKIAASIVAAINGVANCPIEASVEDADGVRVRTSSICKGLVSNEITVTIDCSAQGVTLTAEPVTKATGTVTDMADVLSKLGDVRYHYGVCAMSDAAVIKAWDTELESRYSALRQIGMRLFVGLSGIIGSVSEEGSVLNQAEAINSPHLILIPRLTNPQTGYEWAARTCAAACRILSDDPAANTYDTEVSGLIADYTPKFDERQKLLEAGIATYRTDTTGTVLIERLVTSYTENTDGQQDTSYLDIQIVETVDAIRSYINSEARKRFRTWKLARTEENFGRGAKVMTGGVWRSFLADLYQTVFIQEKQWCQDFERYKNSIQTEVKSGTKTRLEYLHQPELIGQFLIVAGKTQFK